MVQSALSLPHFASLNAGYKCHVSGPSRDFHISERDVARERPLQELMREAELDVACFLEPRALIRRQRHVEGAKIVLELRERPGADDRSRDCRIEQRPGERDLRG